ncbi:MAG: hypothetical protein RLZZ126_2054 [Pseudomonadota bacterium]|jgi:hypothetical protein
MRGWLALDVLTDGIGGGAPQRPTDRLTLLEPCGSAKRTAAALIHLGGGVLVFMDVELVTQPHPDAGGHVVFEFAQVWRCTVLPDSP